VLGLLGVLGVLAVGVTVAVVVMIGGAETGVGAKAGGVGVLDASVTGPAAAVTDQVSVAAQRQAVAHWTRQRMRGATATAVPRGLIRASLPAVTRTPGLPAVGRASGLPRAGRVPGLPGARLSRAGRASAEISAPMGIPTARPFSGSPTTGVLFYTTGGKGHFCSASVVDSTADDLALTAAHCVYSKGFATNIEYVPGYHDGKRPYGVWPVRTITVASGWKLSHDPDLDFAFLTLAAAGGKRIQAKTGGLTIAFTRWYSEKIEVIGHNDSGAAPIRCATRSFRFRTGQMEFYCHGFWTGTSGGPWIIGYNARNGTGTVFGVIGGYERGGDYEWASYSAYFGSSARILYEQVERAATPHPTPSPSPSRTRTTGPTTASPTLTATPSPAGSVSIAYRAPVSAGGLEDLGAVHLA
jgi:V8-like Glu-specific endopeptidase